MKLYILIFILNLGFIKNIIAAECGIEVSIPASETAAAKFLKDSLFALHLQITNESFGSAATIQSRSKIFDTIFNTPHWNRKFEKSNDFIVFWNWVRFQFWGLLQQQALLKEDQGYKVAKDRSLSQAYSSIVKFPIYPFPFSSQTYNCSLNEKSIYPCEKKNLLFNVLLSPPLACDAVIDKTNLNFSYILTNEPMGWTITDVHFKGRNLIKDSFTEYDNLMNKYGKQKALSYLKFLINKMYIVKPMTKPQDSGSFAFDKNYKIKAPEYPISF